MSKGKLLYTPEVVEPAVENLNNTPVDVIHVNVPLFIRLCEYSREDAKNDEDLHRMTERLTEACRDNTVVGMEVYDAVTATVEKDDKAIALEELLAYMKVEAKYGDVAYADAKNKKYPIDTEKHVRAAWAYINQKKNAAEYTAEELKVIKNHIKSAAKKFGIEISDGAKLSLESLSEDEVEKAVDEFTNEMVDGKIQYTNMLVEHLVKVRTIIMKHDVSKVLMQAIDPENKLVDIGICPAYENLEDVPKLYFDETIEKIDNALELYRSVLTQYDDVTEV